MSEQPARGRLFAITGPSGVGKGTLIAKLLEDREDLWLSISATTRTPRPGEIHEQHYLFLTRPEFEQLIAENGFLEYAEFSGNLYGTPAQPVEHRRAAGQDVLLEIEVQGADQIREAAPDVQTIFIAPPSLGELHRRLQQRGTESDEQIQKRLVAAEAELAAQSDFDHVIVNNDLVAATEQLLALFD